MIKKFPEYLGPAGAAWCRAASKNCDFQDRERELLFQAASCLDRIVAAEAAVREHGPVTKDRYDSLKTNPGIVQIRDFRRLFLDYCKALKIVQFEEDKK